MDSEEKTVKVNLEKFKAAAFHYCALMGEEPEGQSYDKSSEYGMYLCPHWHNVARKLHERWAELESLKLYES